MKRFVLALLLAALPSVAAAAEKPRDWQPPPLGAIPNHREMWRQVITEIATYAKGRKADFVVLVRGGVELVVKGEREALWEEVRDPAGQNFEKRLPLRSTFRPYVKMIDGMVVDGLYCGPDALGKPLDKAIKDRLELDATLAEERARGIQRPPVPTPFGPFSLDPKEELRKAAEIRKLAEREERQRRTIYALNALRLEGRRILSIEDCKDQKEVDAAFKGADRDRVLTYAATDADTLARLPKGHPRAENAAPVATVTAARNWLPLLSADRFGTKAEWIMSMERTNHDILLIDVVHRGTDPLTKDEVRRLKFKELGAPRLVLADLSIGKAHDRRYYWQKGWEVGNPPFLVAPVTDTPGSYITDLADPKWKEMLGKYVAGIMDLGFDGVVLDDLDTYLWFEDMNPLEG